MIDRGFFNILRTLNEHNLQYVLIGGLAANMWGSDQITLDVDICYSRDSGNIKILVNALKALDAHLRGWPEGVPEFIDEVRSALATRRRSGRWSRWPDRRRRSALPPR